MKKHFCRFWALVLALVLMLGIVPLSPASATTTTDSTSEETTETSADETASDVWEAGTLVIGSKARAVTSSIATIYQYSCATEFYVYSYREDAGIINQTYGYPSYKTNGTYFVTTDGAVGYCVQPNVPAADTGSTVYAFTDWTMLDSDNNTMDYYFNDPTKSEGILKAMIYGAPNNGKTSTDWYVATATLVCDIICGYRDENLNSRTGQSCTPAGTVGSSPFYSALNATRKSYYDQIISNYQNDVKRGTYSTTLKAPSFTSTNRNRAPEYELTYNSSTGLYETTLTDTNGVLSSYDFTPASTVSGLTVTKTGNKLEITATKDAAKKLESGLLFSSPTYTQSTVLWRNGTATQSFVTLFKTASESTKVYFKIKAKLSEETGYIEIYKYDSYSTSKKLAEAEFEVINRETGEKYKIGPTDNNGYAISSELPLGTYEITEVTAPDGYERKLTSDTVTITEANTTVSTAYTLNVPNDPYVYLEIFKCDSVTGEGLEGATFRLVNRSTKAEYTVGPTDENGYAMSGELPIGTYDITEIQPPEGYQLSVESRTVTLTGAYSTESTAYRVNNWENDPDGGTLIIVKRNARKTDERLAGAYFTVRNVDTGETFTIGPTDSTGTATSSERLPFGEYEIVETTAPEYFEINDNIPNVTISKNNVTDQFELTVIIDEYPIPGEGLIKKTVNIGELAGWTFKIYTDADCTQEFDGVEYVTDSKGEVSVSLPAISPNEPAVYYVKEIPTADTKYWDHDETVHRIEIYPDQTTEIGPFVNTQYGLIEIIKTMATDGSVEGWTFEVECPDGSVIECTTDENGVILSGKLEAGEYTVTEIIPEDSPYYCATDNPQTVTVNAGETATVTFTNALKPGEVEVLKTDEDGTPLVGAKFKLEWSEDGETWQEVTYSESTYVVKGGCNSASLEDGCLITGTDGTATFSNLYPLLQYRITEVETPNNYTLLIDPIYIDSLDVEKDYKYSVTAVNGTVITLPNTGVNDMMVAISVGMAFIVLAVMGLVYVIAFRKRNEN